MLMENPISMHFIFHYPFKLAALFFSSSIVCRNRLVSATTTPDSPKRPIKFGNAIKPFIMSAIPHTTSRVDTAPTKTARTYTIR